MLLKKSMLPKIIIGAGAVVTKSIASSGDKYIGIPAKRNMIYISTGGFKNNTSLEFIRKLLTVLTQLNYLEGSLKIFKMNYL